MKIITDDAVYVQKNDITYLNQYLSLSNLPIPSSIFEKVFGRNIVIIDNSNRYEFIKFDKPEEIEFFQGIDWMIDYNKVKDLSEEEIIALAKSIVEENNEIARRFNSMTPEERKKNINMAFQYELLDFKICSLRDILWFKQGHIKMDLPKGIDFPNEVKQEKGIKKLIKTMFNKKRN